MDDGDFYHSLRSGCTNRHGQATVPLRVLFRYRQSGVSIGLPMARPQTPRAEAATGGRQSGITNAAAEPLGIQNRVSHWP